MNLSDLQNRTPHPSAGSRDQTYGMVNNPSPPYPNFISLQQHQQPHQINNDNCERYGQLDNPALSMQQTDNESNIVGPSDHYGTHHQFINNSASSINKLINNGNNNFNSASMTYDASPIRNYSAKGFANIPILMQKEETKVCVIVDSRTPVLFKVPVSPEKITLADLKAAMPDIDRPEYKYFFKSSDSEFGIVKEEIHEDSCQLPTYRNRVVAWIVTPSQNCLELAPNGRSDTCNTTYTNTSYDDGSSSLLSTDIDTTSYFTETDEDSATCSNYSEATGDTFISQRRNHRYAKGRSPNYQPRHNHHSSNSPYHYDSMHDRVLDPNEKLSRSSSSTTSSASRSDATAVHCLAVQLVLTNENFLGLHIYANAVNGVDEGIYVEEVKEDSAVALDGRIEPGDKLIQVNDINLEELSNEEAVRSLKEEVMKRGPLKLVVAKFVENNRNDDIDGVIGPREAVHPIDTAAWVAHAQAITIPNVQNQANSANSSPSFDSYAQDTDCIRPASTGMARLNSALRLNKQTTDIKEMIQHMKVPEIGLDIRDREWLKIRIPRAFLGSDLVNWLERNVYGFCNNRDAKKFARRMLKEGYIRDPIARRSFSSKSYYTFVI